MRSCGWRLSSKQLLKACANAVQEEVEPVGEEIPRTGGLGSTGGGGFSGGLRDDGGQGPAGGYFEDMTRLELWHAEADERVDLRPNQLRSRPLPPVATRRRPRLDQPREPRVLRGLLSNDIGQGGTREAADVPGLHPTYPLRIERLELRPHRMADLDDLFAFHSRPEVVRYTPWPVRDREETRVALEKKLTQGELTEPGQWLVLAIELRSTGTVIGEVLLKWASAEDRQGEIGFALHTDYQGKGLAAEAAREMLRVGFEELGLHRIVAVLDDRNGASARLLERLGMRREAHHLDALVFKGEWANEYVYALLEDEWRAVSS
jgi:RimJ/RimL family protein N-acetyltransferase